MRLLQVAPSELEDLIRRHPGVNDVAVVGVPDERSGELPRAYVVRKNRNVEEQVLSKIAQNWLFFADPVVAVSHKLHINPGEWGTRAPGFTMYTCTMYNVQ